MQHGTVEHFRRAFSAHPTHVVRAPGRVNLIGEHIDYNGLPVFPMAIGRAITIAMRARDDRHVRLANVDARHGAREFEISEKPRSFARGDWGNYALAASAILRERHRIARGFDGVVSGDIPAAAGLSSSSALVVACALALVTANGLDVARTELMELTALGERFVGVESGGMDQAICLGAQAGHASVIRFDPIRLEHVRVPDDWRFVIVQSFVEAAKSGRAREAYNARVAECRAALEQVRARVREWPATYAALVESVGERELLEVALETLPEPLSRRFRHVVTEARRVERARAAMQGGDLATFGRLMDESHASLAHDYEVSCPELDEIVATARAAGAAGARLTGAGFGGSAVVLARAADERRILAAFEDPSRERAFVAQPSRAELS